MAIVEGVGDEVLYLFFTLLVCAVLGLAWLSTGFVEWPQVNVIVLDRPLFHELLGRIRSSTGNVVLHIQQIRRRDEILPAVQEEEESPVQGNSHNGAVEAASRSGDVGSEVRSSGASENHGESEGLDNPSGELSDSARSATTVCSMIHNDQNRSCSQERRANVCGESPVRDTRNKGLILDDETTSSNDRVVSSNDGNSGGSSLQTATSVVHNDSLVNSTGNDREFSSQNIDSGRINIRLKYLDDRQRMVVAYPQETIGEFKRKHFSDELSDDHVVRLIVNGQELKQDASTLGSYNIKDESVIHCLLSQVQRNSSTGSSPASNSGSRQQQDDAASYRDRRHRSSVARRQLDLSILMFPLLTILLGVLWYCRIAYRPYFNATSTLFLVSVTFVFFVGVMASVRSARAELHEFFD